MTRHNVALLASVVAIVLVCLGFWLALPAALLGIFTLLRAWFNRPSKGIDVRVP